VTVDAAYISAISNGLYTVSDTTGTISTTTFSLYLNQATAQVAAEFPSFASSYLKDEAIGLLVCHRIVRADGRLEFNSESIDGVSYNKQAGETTWSLAYNKMLQGMKGKGSASVSVTHSDVDSSLKFDEAPVLS